MSIDALQLRHEIIRPVLKHLDPVIPYSMAGESLLMGTCAVESRMGQAIVQYEGGPAKGIWQMEPATETDIHLNFLSFREELRDLVASLQLSVSGIAVTGSPELTGNLYYTALGRGPSAQAIGRIEQKLKDLPILGSLIDIVDFDTAGRAVLKASPERKVIDIGPSQARSIAAQAGAVGATTSSGEQ